MAKLSKVFLVGPMGAGKTTIGKALAHQLKLDFVDSDTEIEERTGADIPWIFDVEGEEGFRERECQVIEELSQRNGIVLATGGGAVVRAENRRALAARGFVVYLRTSIDQQVARTRNDRRRPLLQDGDPEQILRDLMSVRDPLYREIADYIAETDGSGARSLAERIAHQISEF
jgi:shikimate kinase